MAALNEQRKRTASLPRGDASSQKLHWRAVNLAVCLGSFRSRVALRVRRRSARITMRSIGGFVRPGEPDACERGSDRAAGAAPTVCR